MFPMYLQFPWRDLVFPILLFSSISLHYSLKNSILSLPAILLNSAFSWVWLSLLPFASLLSQLFVKPPQTTTLTSYIYFSLGWFWLASLVAQTVKHLPIMWETWVRSLGREDPLEKEMASHSSTLAWKIQWTEEPGELQSTGLQRVVHNWVTSLGFDYHLPTVLWTSVHSSSGTVYQIFSLETIPDFDLGHTSMV